VAQVAYVQQSAEIRGHRPESPFGNLRLVFYRELELHVGERMNQSFANNERDKFVHGATPQQ
jgi:hypothetical protein